MEHASVKVVVWNRKNKLLNEQTLININEECEKLILKRLSEAMDNEVYKNKVAIVSRVSNKKGKQIEYIISKGKVDNHFWVRNVANR